MKIAHKKVGSCLAVALLAVLALSTAYLSLWAARPMENRSALGGQVEVSDCCRGDTRMLFLDGEWEAFPGQLIVSEDVPGAPELSAVPNAGMALSGGRASYRLTLTGQREDVQLMITFPGLMCDYRIFVDGRPAEVYSVTPNYLQFVVLRGGGRHEVVLEIRSGGEAGLNVCPIAMDVNELFRWIFGVRSTHLTFLGLLIFAFILFPILYARGKIVAQKLKPYFVTGVLVLLFYVGKTIWFYGVLDIVKALLPLAAVPVLELLLVAGIELTMLWHMQAAQPKSASRRETVTVASAVLASVTGSLVCHFCFGPGAERLLLALSLLLTAGAVLAAVIRCIRRDVPPPLVYAFGDLFLLAGMAVASCSGYSLVRSPELLILPAAMLLFLFCWNLAVAQYRQDEIALLQNALDVEQRMLKTQGAFLASQIQPHFLYNTLITIQELCYSDPGLAADTVLHFADYLRQNIDFMDYKEKVPFPEELKHINHYIHIQRARFEDAVMFVLDIGTEDFELPPLTVQPLIENAVSHGIRRGSGRGQVRLTTLRTGDEVQVRVEDDGAGFDPASVQKRSLENIRSRVELTMHGSMTIRSSPGAGCAVTLHLPWKEAQPHADCSC